MRLVSTICVLAWFSQAMLVRSSSSEQQPKGQPRPPPQRKVSARFSMGPDPDQSNSGSEEKSAASSSSSSSSSSSIVSADQRKAFAKDGYIVVRNLFSEQEIEDLIRAGESLVRISQQDRYQTFSVVEKNLIYGRLGITPSTNDGDERKNDETGSIVRAFRHIALRSKLPQICAELMSLDPATQCLRLIRDVFLAKYVSTGDTCDWHVDDQSFWPQSFLSSSSSSSSTTRSGDTEEQEHCDQDGINVWIAMDDYSQVHGGSMIVSTGSHKAPWRQRAYLAIGQDRSVDGGMTREQIAQRFSDPDFKGTCALDMTSPEVRAMAERAKVEFDLKKGDCIIATRLLFHRTSRVTEVGARYYAAQGKTLLHRYSVRYVPGTARLPQGHLSEISAKYDASYAGNSLDEISQQQPAWYPKLWPSIEHNLDQKLDRLAQNELPKAIAQSKADLAELMKLLKDAELKTNLKT